MTQRLGTTIIEVARDLMAVMAPTTGVRSTGRVFVRAKRGSGEVYLPCNWFLMAVVNGAAREELIFKVGKGPNVADYTNGKRNKADPAEPDAGSWWVINENGIEVDIVSLIGGARHNLKKGTKLIFDPPPLGLELEATLTEDMTDGADPTWLGGCMSMVQFETMGGASATLDAFRSAAGNFPAVVIVWDGSEPADGSTQSSLDRGATRVGPGQQLFKERFNIFVLSKRMDSDHLRRNEGLKLLDDISFWLTDAMSVDDQQFSVPTGVQIRARQRVAGDGNAYQQLYVYLLQVSVTALWRRYDARTFADLKLINNRFLSFDLDAFNTRVEVVNQDIDTEE